MRAPSNTPDAGLEIEMPEKTLSWFDRLLLKLALAKAVARGHCAASLVQEAEEAFRSVNRAADTSR